VCPKNPANFNVDNVRVAKLLGGGLHNSTVVRGLVLKSDAVGSIKRVEKAKVSTVMHLHIERINIFMNSSGLSRLPISFFNTLLKLFIF
jgi:chaperonin GroEL (HSP60 family)